MYKLLNFARHRIGSHGISHISKHFLSRRDHNNIKNMKLVTINKESLMFQPDEISNKPLNDEDLYFSNNLYLQIISCLKKLGVLDDLTEENKFEKFKEILNDQKVKINDEEIMKLINLSNTKKYVNKEINENDLEKDEQFSEIMDYVQKIINEELSEEEFTEGNKMKIRFKRPPHTLNELKSVLEQAEEIYQKKRKILMNDDEQVKKETSEKFLMKIPNYLLLRSLTYPTTNSEIIVVGVKRNSNLHSLFLSNFLESFKPDMISVHLPPDIPLFIKAEGNFKNDWRSFVAANENFHFLINPLPNSVNDILITPRKMELMFDENFALSKEISVSPKMIFSYQSNIIISCIFNKLKF
jgi:hypothetical protein